MLGYGGGLAFLYGVAHLALRRFAPHADPVLLPAATLINGLGLAMIHRLDLAYADRAEQLGREVPSAAAPAQLTWMAVGVVLVRRRPAGRPRPPHPAAVHLHRHGSPASSCCCCRCSR